MYDEKLHLFIEFVYLCAMKHNKNQNLIMKKLKTLFIIALCALTACSPSEKFQTQERVSLYEMYEAGSKFYRIPALTKAKDGALVAIADKRGDALGDLPNIITIVSKRSTDGGKTWSDMSIVAQGDTVAKCGYGDAVVIADEVKGNLVAVFSGNNGLWASNEKNLSRTYTSISTDNGKSWNKVVDSPTKYMAVYMAKEPDMACLPVRVAVSSSKKVLMPAD